MSTVDSLDIQISASAQKASASLDKLIGKLDLLSMAMNKIDVNKISSQFKFLSDSFNGTNVKNFENISKSAKEAESSLTKLSNQSKKAIRTRVTFDISDYQKVAKELSVKFSDAGKDIQFSGDLSKLEKASDKLTAKLDTLSQKEQKIVSIGSTSPDSKMFQNLQYDISSTLNQLDALEIKIRELKSSFSNEIANIPIIRYDKNFTEIQQKTEETAENIKASFGKIPESAKYSVEKAQESLEEALASVRGSDEDNTYRDYTKEISELQAQLKQLESSGIGMGSDKWDETYIALRKVKEEAKEYKAQLDNPTAGIEDDIVKTNSLGNKVDELKEKLKELNASGLNFGDEEYDKAYASLKNVSSELSAYKSKLIEGKNETKSASEIISTAFQNVLTSVKSVGSGISSFFVGAIKKAASSVSSFLKNIKSSISPLNSVKKSTNGLAGKVFSLFIAFQSFRGLGNVVSTLFSSASDYIEEFNYFDVSISKIAEESKGEYEKYGYKNAEEYAESFESRLTELTKKMSGFQIGESGELYTNLNIKNLGLDVTEITNFKSRIAQMTNSVGMLGEASIASAKGLTMLAGDMSSLSNTDLSTVMNNFSSAITGASTAVKKYGIDTSTAALGETALSLGVKKNVSDMTQAEKEYLRVITMVNQSKVAWGDLANTINQPANQLRMLKNNFKQITLIIGNMFMPIVQKVLPYINAMVIAIKDLAQWVSNLFELKWSDSSQAAPDNSAWEDLGENADDAADSIDDATDAQKKFNKQLQSFDKLNNLTTSDSSSSDKDDDSGSDVSGVLSDALINAVEEYEKRWNKAFSSMSSKADELAKKIEALFSKAWDTGDGSDIGKAIASWINKGISWVNNNVDTFANGLKKIANLMATAFNGFVEKLEWSGLGTAIGKSLKAFFDAETHFFDTVNWTNFGSSLATSANAAISTGVIQSYIKSIASKLKAAIETAFGAVTTFDFGGLGEALGEGINDFFDTMGKVNKKTGLTGWQELGVTISESITGLATTITTAIETLDPSDIGNAIGEVFGKIKFKEIGIKFSDMADALLTYITKAIKGVPWEDLGQDIADLIKGIKWAKLTWDFAKLGSAILGAIEDFFTGLSGGNEILGKIETAILGIFALMKWTGLGSEVFSELSKEALKKIAEKMGAEYTAESTLVTLVGGKIKNGIVLAVNGIKDLATSIATGAKAIAKTILQTIAVKVGAEQATIGSISSSIGTSVATAFSAVPGLMTGSLSGLTTASAGAVAATIFSAFVAALAAAFAGFHLGQKIGKMIMSDDQKQYSYHLNLSDVIKWDSDDWSDFWQAFADWWVDVQDWWADKALAIKTTFGNWKESLIDWWTDVKKYWGDKYVAITSEVKEKVSGALAKMKATWDSVKTKTATLIGKAKNASSSVLSKLKDSWGDIKSKSATLTAKAKNASSSVLSKLKDSWGDIKSKSATLTAKAKNASSSVLSKLKDSWDSFSSKTATLTATFNDMFTGPLKSAWNAIAKAINGAIKTINKVPGVNIKATLPMLAKGGIYEGGQWRPITKFAGGGYPNSGQMFIAREAGPELVGTIGGHTAVVNNDQIVASVSDGVYNALNPVLTSLCVAINKMNSSNGNGEISIEIDGDNVFRVVKKKEGEYYKRNGKGAFSH